MRAGGETAAAQAHLVISSLQLGLLQSGQRLLQGTSPASGPCEKLDSIVVHEALPVRECTKGAVNGLKCAL